MQRRRFSYTGLGLAALLGSGCPRPAGVVAPPIVTVTATVIAAAPDPAGPPQLVCYGPDGKLVVAAADGRRLGGVRAEPPQELVALATAQNLLVGASQGKLWALLPGASQEGRHWQQIARWDPAQWSTEPLRAASYGNSAVVWMRGNDSGTVPAALEVTAQGQVIRAAVSVAEQSLGGIWQSSYAPPGPYDRSFPSALRLLIGQVRMSGQDAREELLHSERSPWGGRLVAPNLGLPMRGDWPDAPLFYIGAAAAAPVELQYDGQPLLFRGLIGYGAAAQLYLDGRFAQLGSGVLVVDPPGSPGQGGGKGGKSLNARVVPGLRPPCAIVSADWHE